MPPLTPSQLYPANTANVATRFVRLSTGVTLRVAESGPASGVPVIMLHGWGASLYTWRHAFRLLPSYGIRAIGVDLRGFGLSDRPSGRDAYTLDAYCADLDALYAALELPDAALLGHSMGGTLALRYALRSADRVRRLALVNPAGLVPIVYPTIARAAPRPLTQLLPERFVSRSLIAFVLRRLAYGNASLVTERDVDEYWAPTQLPGFVAAATAALCDFDWRPLPADLAVSLAPPTVVLLGRTDRLIHDTRAAAERLRGAQVHELAGGHCAHEEQPDEACAILGSFIR